MATISLCMIVKNEEKMLSRCLESVLPAVDEIIIVDTGSTDGTKSVAQKFTQKVYDFEWTDDFSAARNYAYDHASMEWQLWLDADDILQGSELEKLLELKKSLPPDIDMVTMKYHTHFGKNGELLFSSTRERLTRTSRHYRWQDPVHECIPMEGRILHSDIAVWHRKAGGGASTRNLDIYLALESSGKAMTPRQQYYFARELLDHRQYAKAAHYFRGFLEEGKGWAEDNIAACYNLAVCLTRLGEENGVLPVLVKSFGFGSPRAEICCELGYFFKRRGDFKTALEWFRVAAGLSEPDSLGFVMKDYWGYIPNLECCVCCCFLGRYKEAWEYNEKAGVLKPDSPEVAHNRKFLSAQNI